MLASRRFRIAVLATLGLLLLQGACAKRSTVPAPASGAEASLVIEPNKREAPGTVAPSGAKLRDGEILKVLAALNDAEVEQAKVAFHRSQTPTVRALAQRLMEEHARLLGRCEQVAKRANLRLASTPLAERLAYESRQFVETMNATRDRELDLLYVGAETGEDEDMREMVRARLIPQATASELQALLADELAIVDADIIEATRVERELASQVSSKASSHR